MTVLNLHEGVTLRHAENDVIGVVTDSWHVDAYGNSGPFTYVRYAIQWSEGGSVSLTRNQVEKAGWFMADDDDAKAYALEVLGARALEAFSR
jgi:hypothetical protein